MIVEVNMSFLDWMYFSQLMFIVIDYKVNFLGDRHIDNVEIYL
jgi:hypothetical protein